LYESQAGAPFQFSVVVDACAAPGNKASHAAGIALQPHGTVVAVEADRRRQRLLRDRLFRLKCYNVRVVAKDWLEVRGDEQGGLIAEAEAVLVDPSCSNSGTLATYGDGGGARGGQSSEGARRIAKLAAFQEKALLHALALPKVKRVVYSTCSIHDAENEDVVASVLAKSAPAFTLERALPAWPRRGRPGRLAPSLADCCIRVDSRKDLAHGFFVACFVRVSE